MKNTVERVNSDDLVIDNYEKIMSGESPFITFTAGLKVVGELWFKDGKLSFTGDADKSAEIFFDSMKYESSKYKFVKK